MIYSAGPRLLEIVVPVASVDISVAHAAPKQNQNKNIPMA